MDKYNGEYDDIIDRQPPVYERRARMSMHDRAAQFAPFAALTGFDDQISETVRLTDRKPELSDRERQILAHYDNAVLYNDSIVDQIISRFEDRCLYGLYDGKTGLPQCFPAL